MELLVALVIGSLVITLAVRGLGLGLNVYERVVRASASLDVKYREAAWWTDSVASLLPCSGAEPCLEGGPFRFRGHTLAGILQPPGRRTPVRWELADNGGRPHLRIREGNGRPLTMTRSFPEGARFAYRHPDGRWLSSWDRNSADQRLPEAIRIETVDGRPLAWAATVQRPLGRLDYREVLGL